MPGMQFTAVARLTFVMLACLLLGVVSIVAGLASEAFCNLYSERLLPEHGEHVPLGI